MSPLESHVMEIVWRLGSCTVEEIIPELARSRRRLEDSTIRTLLSRLEEKGYVSRRMTGRQNVYGPRLKRKEEAMRRIREVVDRFLEGSVERLILGIIENERLRPEDIRRLARKVAKIADGGVDGRR